MSAHPLAKRSRITSLLSEAGEAEAFAEVEGFAEAIVAAAADDLFFLSAAATAFADTASMSSFITLDSAGRSH